MEMSSNLLPWTRLLLQAQKQPSLIFLQRAHASGEHTRWCDILCPFSVNSTKSSRYPRGLGFKIENTRSKLPSERRLAVCLFSPDPFTMGSLCRCCSSVTGPFQTSFLSPSQSLATDAGAVGLWRRKWACSLEQRSLWHGQRFLTKWLMETPGSEALGSPYSFWVAGLNPHPPSFFFSVLPFLWPHLWATPCLPIWPLLLP